MLIPKNNTRLSTKKPMPNKYDTNTTKPLAIAVKTYSDNERSAMPTLKIV